MRVSVQTAAQTAAGMHTRFQLVSWFTGQVPCLRPSPGVRGAARGLAQALTRLAAPGPRVGSQRPFPATALLCLPWTPCSASGL